MFPSCTIACEIAGPIEPFAGFVERVRNEALGGEIRPLDIAAREAGSADVELARNADRSRTTIAIENIEAPIGYRASDRRALLIVFVDLEQAGGAGGFGRAVGIVDAQARKAATRDRDMLHRERLPSDEDASQRAQGVG